MLVGALRTLEGRPSPLVVPAFYWKLLAAEGLRPELDACTRCGETEGIVAFDMHEGGVLCRACRRGTAISPEALRLTRMILGGEMNDALLEAPSGATSEVAHLATAALESLLERRLRSVAMFEHH
jgi:DNA repair protein RecO (recombination protein O)